MARIIEVKKEVRVSFDSLEAPDGMKPYGFFVAIQLGERNLVELLKFPVVNITVKEHSRKYGAYFQDYMIVWAGRNKITRLKAEKILNALKELKATAIQLKKQLP